MSRLRRGFSLVELLTVIAIIGVLVGFAVPKISSFRASSNMSSAKAQLAASIATARSSALQKGRQATFKVVNSRVTVSVLSDTARSAHSYSPTGVLTLLSNIPLDDRYGVTLTPRSAADSLIYFDARGFGSTGSGSRAVYVMSGNGKTDSVCVSSIGLITKTGCGA